MDNHGMPLNRAVSLRQQIKHVARDGVCVWDCLLIKTYNSSYMLKKVDDKNFEISGGWFDKKGLSPSRMIIRGCTWGGSIIHIDMLAAIGLRVEFGNNVITSPVKQIIVIKAQNLN